MFGDEDYPDYNGGGIATSERESLLDSIVEHTTTLEQIKKAETTAHINEARRHPRIYSEFQKRVKAIACTSPSVAASCRFELPRKTKSGDPIEGPSIRMAEICASQYRNLEVGARIIAGEEQDARAIVAEAWAHDLETHVRWTSEVRTKTTYKDGRPYNDDMRIMTGNAACSKALRNAIFRAIPRALVDQLMEDVNDVRLGKSIGLKARLEQITKGFHLAAKLEKFDISDAQICGLVGKADMADLDWDDVGRLLGIGTAIKDRETTLKESLANGADKKEDSPLKTPKSRKATNGATEKKPEREDEIPMTSEPRPIMELRDKAHAAGIGDPEFDGMMECMNIEEVEEKITERRSEMAGAT